MAPQAVSAYYSSQWIAFIAVRLKLAGVKSYAGNAVKLSRCGSGHAKPQINGLNATHFSRIIKCFIKAVFKNDLTTSMSDSNYVLNYNYTSAVGIVNHITVAPCIHDDFKCSSIPPRVT